MTNLSNAPIAGDSLGPLGTARRDYWLCQLAGWGSFAVVGILSSGQPSTESTVRMALTKSACMMSGLALSHLWHGFLRSRGWLDRNRAFPFGRILAGLALLGVLQVAFLVLFDLLFRRGAFLDERAELPELLLMLFFLWFGVFLVWTLFYVVVLSRRRALRYELEKLELEVSV